MTSFSTAQYVRGTDSFRMEDSFDLSTAGETNNNGHGFEHVRFVNSTLRYSLDDFNYWQERTTLEKIFLVTIIVILLFTSLLLVLLSIGQGTSSSNGKERIHVITYQNVCLTSECVKLAASMLSAMDQSADPCVNFYQYACGGWEKSNPIPNGRSSWSTFEMLSGNNQIILKNILESKFSKDVSLAAKKAQMYYFSCIDKKGDIETLGGLPLVELIDSCGGWNITRHKLQFNISKFDFQKTFQKLQNKLHVPMVFAWNIGENNQNSSQYIIQIDQGGLSLPARDYYLKSDNDSKKVLKALEDMMVHMCTLLLEETRLRYYNSSVSAADIINLRYEIQKIIELEIKIAKITKSTAKRRDEQSLYNLYTIKQLNMLAPFLDWHMFFNDAFSYIGVEIDWNEPVVVYAPEFLSNMTHLIKDYTQTVEGNNTLNNYLIWHLVHAMRSTLSKAYRDSVHVLEKALLGTEKRIERWRTCVSETEGMIGFALSAMFVRKTFEGDSKLLAESMIHGVRNSFMKNIEDIAWMDNKTKLTAIQKAKSVTEMIGYPDYVLSNSALDEKYMNLNFSDGYFDNNIMYVEFKFKKNLGKLFSPVNKSEWSMMPSTVNAYYTPTKNQIVFPAGLLQSPYFNLDYPKSVNYGAMGVVMGHELSHGFDDQGREYDIEGNMRDWWNNDTLTEFKNRTNCMVDQYSDYEIDKQAIRGKQTLGENIADNGGIKAAYYAYLEWLNDQAFEEERPLPGVNLTHQQLFFLSYSQVWCSVSTPQSSKLQLLEDSHSPGRFRVIGTLSNSIEFSQVYACPVNSPMNPSKKCHVW